MKTPKDHVRSFCEQFGLRVPVLLAPMAGVPAPSLSVAAAKAGGLGACGVLLMNRDAILAWCAGVRASGATAFQLNAWVPDPAPRRDVGHEAEVRAFLAKWGPPVAADAGDARPPDFEEQCEAILTARPTIASSVMGLFPAEFVRRLKGSRIPWFATVTTVAEARAAEAAGADGIIAQGMEAGGHRGCFDAGEAERRQVGLIALLPAVIDAVTVPVVAAGGIGDERALAAALVLGASAVQVGTAFLRCPEAAISPSWAKALATTAPEGTVVTRVFSGRAGRSIATEYVCAAMAPTAPPPAPYPVQRGLTRAMRHLACEADDLRGLQAWAGQAASLARAEPAAEVVQRLWNGALAILDTVAA